MKPKFHRLIISSVVSEGLQGNFQSIGHFLLYFSVSYVCTCVRLIPNFEMLFLSYTVSCNLLTSFCNYIYSLVLSFYSPKIPPTTQNK